MVGEWMICSPETVNQSFMQTNHTINGYKWLDNNPLGKLGGVLYPWGFHGVPWASPSHHGFQNLETSGISAAVMAAGHPAGTLVHGSS